MQMETRRTEELKPHQASRDISGKNEDIADLAASIRANGVLVLFTAKPEGTILSGSRPVLNYKSGGHRSTLATLVMFFRWDYLCCLLLATNGTASRARAAKPALQPPEPPCPVGVSGETERLP